jgi:hypothetical protein
MRGFMEACNDFTATPKQWDRIKEVLYEVEDFNDNPDIDEEATDWNDWYHRNVRDQLPLSGSITATQGHSPAITFTSSSSATHINATVWNDQMGNWHYTNYPEGFGYYERPDNKKEKQQLND